MPAHGEALWGADDVVAEFHTDEFSDLGERVAFDHVGGRQRGAVLDIGVGGGRTTLLLAPVARSYVGIDIAEPMVSLARERNPGADLQVGDVRDLSRFADGAFDLVVFSFNGLDSVDHTDRAQALAEMTRVLAPDGRMLFSNLNLDGISFDERPWQLRGFRSGRALVHLGLAVRHPGAFLQGWRNYRRTRRLSQDGPGWALRPMRAHEFRFVVHFATLANTVASVREAGLVVTSAYDEQGQPVDPSAEHTDADYVHFVCRHA